MFGAKVVICTLVDVTLSTTDWGMEVSWKIVDKDGDTVCASQPPGSYSDHTTHEAEVCSLAPNSTHLLYPYTLTCEDTYGDGWHGGRLFIQGTCYCDDFLSGFSKNKNLTIIGKLTIS